MRAGENDFRVVSAYKILINIYKRQSPEMQAKISAKAHKAAKKQKVANK